MALLPAIITRDYKELAEKQFTKEAVFRHSEVRFDAKMGL